MAQPLRFDIAIIGGGVIGLSIAWQLSKAGTNVVVIDRQAMGSEASWAGAGILPPWKMEFAEHAKEKLSALSFEQHDSWAMQLREQSGIDTGFRRCGAAFVARTTGEAGALLGQALEWEERGVQVERLETAQLCEIIPAFAPQANNVLASVFLPEEAQLRNPDHLKALIAACQKNGVTFLAGQGDVVLSKRGDRVSEITTSTGQTVVADRFCVAAGAWSQGLLEPLGVSLSTLPVRGQMSLYKIPNRPFNPILYEGTRYIVPRDDGHIVVGATLEEAGFDKSTTESGIEELRHFAEGLVDGLSEANLVKSWAGLRPASFDGFPYIGPAPSCENLWIATSHFRNGLLWSTGTAILMSQMLRGEAVAFDLSAFRIERG